MAMPESFLALFSRFVAALQEDGLLVSEYGELLFALKAMHDKELEMAMRGFLDERITLDTRKEWAAGAIRAFARECDRKDVRERIGRSCEDADGMLDAIMYPSNEWSFDDLRKRLDYLLGGEI